MGTKKSAVTKIHKVVQELMTKFKHIKCGRGGWSYVWKENVTKKKQKPDLMTANKPTPKENSRAVKWSLTGMKQLLRKQERN